MQHGLHTQSRIREAEAGTARQGTISPSASSSRLTASLIRVHPYPSMKESKGYWVAAGLREPVLGSISQSLSMAQSVCIQRRDF